MKRKTLILGYIAIGMFLITVANVTNSLNTANTNSVKSVKNLLML